MYNDRMPVTVVEIRKCEACGLRYPLIVGHPLGRRCPVCMGETRLMLRREPVSEPAASPKGVASPRATGQRAVILDNIRSAWNVGSIFRSAEGFGFTHAYLCGITSTPDNDAVMKTSLGAEESVSWSYHKDAVQLVKGLKKEGWRVFALEDDLRAHPIDRAAFYHGDAALIVGNEISGVDPELLDLCDMVFFIPMHGEKRSFNVAVAFGIAAFALHQE